MPYLRDRVIVLKKEPFREQDRRYVMYGREHGLLTAVARGASSPRSKQAGHLEPFSESEVMIAKGAAFDTLAVAKLVAAGNGPRAASLSFYAISGAFSDLVIKLTRQGIADDRIFFLLRDLIGTLASMPASPSPERARLIHSAATLRLLDLIGFAPLLPLPTPGASPDNRWGVGGATTPVPHLALAAFMRSATFADVLRVTAPREVLNMASAFVEESLKHAPLAEEPHGPKTILAYLG